MLLCVTYEFVNLILGNFKTKEIVFIVSMQRPGHCFPFQKIKKGYGLLALAVIGLRDIVNHPVIGFTLIALPRLPNCWDQ